MSTMKVVLIAGLGHSGTTILDLALSHHPGIIGLGEVFDVLRDCLAALRSYLIVSKGDE